jgi:hypothetical protein
VRDFPAIAGALASSIPAGTMVAIATDQALHVFGRDGAGFDVLALLVGAAVSSILFGVTVELRRLQPDPEDRNK